MPVRVDVDCEVNASARLRRGLLSLGQRDLVLTIGLPLVAGLSARQLAGVLAHEFGHFAQGAGMAFTYVIRSVNGWFARVVFERDTWDEALAAASRQLDLRIGIVLWVARGAVWLVRQVLHGLMHVGHAIACLQLRQMEFDADYYEAHVAGSAAFAATSLEIRRLGLGGSVAFGELGELWRDKRLVDDYPGFVLQRRHHLAREIDTELGRHAAEKTRWFDTHPSHADRDAAARALDLPGLFQGDAPASALFHQFDELCREATAHYYREALELEFEPGALLPTTAAARPGQEASTANDALTRLAGSALTLDRPLLWTEADLKQAPPTPDPAALCQHFAALRAELDRLRPEAEKASQQWLELRDRWLLARTGREFILARVDIPPEAFGLAQRDAADATARIAALARELEATPPALAAYESALHRWGMLVAGTARMFADSLPGDLAARIAETGRRLTDYRPWLRAFPQWSAEQRIFALGARYERVLDAQRNYTLLGQQCERNRALAAEAPSLVAGLPWPLAPEHAPRTAKEQLERAVENQAPAQHLLILLNLISELYFHSVGRLAAQGEELEAVLAQSELA